MALPEFFDRAALSAAQVLGGFDRERFVARLSSVRIGIAFNPGGAASHERDALLDLTVRLLARLYPTLVLAAPAAASSITDRLASLAREINPHIELRSRGGDVGILVGNPTRRFPVNVAAGSDGWDALIDNKVPQPVGDSDCPFGAGAAACLAAGNVFRQVFLDDPQPDTALRLSTYLGERGATPSDASMTTWLEAAVLVGAGAVGNAAAWSLARSSLAGHLHLVDHERIDLGNLQRYVMAARADEGSPKVDVLARAFNGQLAALPHPDEWAEFVSEQGYVWQNVIVAVDSARDRRAVQASLPRWIANGWTQPGDLGVSVHGRFAATGACLACLYLPDGEIANDDVVVANALGIPHLLAEVRTLLYNGTGVATDLLQEMALGLDRPLELLLPFEGRPIRDLYVEGVCGGAVLPLGSVGQPRQDVHVPLAHQSALAGVLLAAALARAAGRPPEAETAITRVNVLRSAGSILSQPARRRADGRCLCDDPDFVAAYAEKYVAALSEDGACL